VKPAVVCGSEKWSMTEIDMNRLGTWEREILSRMYGSVVEQRMWRIKSNQELWWIHKDLDIVADIKNEKL